MEVGHSAMTKRKGQWSTKHYTKKLMTWNPQQSRVWTQLLRRTSSCRSQWDEVRLFDKKKTISNRPISWLREIQGTGFASTFTGNRLRQYIYKEQASTVYLQGTGFDSIFTGNRLRQYIYGEQASTVYLQGTGFDSIFTGNRLWQYIYREQASTVYLQGTGFDSIFTGNRLRQYIYREQALTVYLQGTGFDSIFTGNRIRQYIYGEQALTVYLLPFLFSLFIVSQPYFDSLFILLCVSLTGKTMSINHFTGTPFFRETTMERPRLHKMKRNLSLIGNT